MPHLCNEEGNWHLKEQRHSRNSTFFRAYDMEWPSRCATLSQRTAPQLQNHTYIQHRLAWYLIFCFHVIPELTYCMFSMYDYGDQELQNQFKKDKLYVLFWLSTPCKTYSNAPGGSSQHMNYLNTWTISTHELAVTLNMHPNTFQVTTDRRDHQQANIYRRMLSHTMKWIRHWQHTS